MEVSQISSSTCIKSNAAQLVKRVLRWGSICIFLAVFFCSAFAAEGNPAFPEFEAKPPTPSENPPAPTKTAKKPVDDKDDDQKFDENGPLPDIEARTFDLKVVKRSNSNKVYLFDDVSKSDPTVGRILLLKQDEERFMAFRVLKTYPEKNMIAAKRVKRYRNHRYLEDGEKFRAIEKISDVAPPPNTPQDNADLAELEVKQDLKVLPFDEELDGGITPPPPVNNDGDEKKDRTPAPTDEEIEFEKDSHLAITVEEPKIIDHNIHWLTAGFGFIRNNGPPAAGGSYNFSAGNVRYGISLARMVFLAQPHLQDSITIEGGFYLYKAINFATTNDAYTIISLLGNLRYNLLFSESFGIFFYAGILQSRVIASNSGDANVISSLTSNLPAGGMGLLFQVGPSWYIRTDIGVDSMGLNLLLRL